MSVHMLAPARCQVGAVVMFVSIERQRVIFVSIVIVHWERQSAFRAHCRWRCE